jgi:hypothetical protein
MSTYNFKVEPNTEHRTYLATFTQLVWKSTKRAGCAIVDCAEGYSVVCRYDPPGNIAGQYVANVLAP